MGKCKVWLTVAEKRRSYDDVGCAKVEYLARAIDGADPAADAARAHPAGVPDERIVAARANRRVEIDELQLRKAGEPCDPAIEIRVLERQPFALHELHDLLAAQVDRGDEHESLLPHRNAAGVEVALQARHTLLGVVED